MYIPPALLCLSVMKIKQLFTDDNAVSPVIGVILMVAITVILAAVIAAFVLGLGGSSTETPQASFDFDYDGSVGGTTTALTITAESGDTISASQVTLEGTVDTDWATESAGTGANDDITAGSTATLAADQLTGGETVNIVWTASSGDDSSILGSFDVPNDHTQ